MLCNSFIKSKCVNKDKCKLCNRNPNLKDYCQLYQAVCKYGYTDCVNDPAHICYPNRDRYIQLYGLTDPSKLVKFCDKCNKGSDYYKDNYN